MTNNQDSQVNLQLPAFEPLGDTNYCLAKAEECFKTGDFGRAEGYLLKVLSQHPMDPAIKFRLSDVYASMHKWENAYLISRELKSQFPRDVTILDKHGAMCAFTARHAEAKAAFEHALELSPRAARVSWNYSLALLQMGEWGEAWPLYDWGRLIAQRVNREIAPEWDGRPIDGKTLYIWWEQGFGDTIMFWRLIGKAMQRSRAAKVIVEVQDALIPLLAPAANDVLTVVAPQPDNQFALRFDEHCSIVSLCKKEILNIDSPKALGGKPYIHPPKGRIPAPSHGKRLGVCWKGNAAHFNDAHRSISPLTFFSALLPLKDKFTLVSLMPEVDLPTDAGFHIEKPGIQSFAHTAETLAACDAVLTVDTAVLHLAGAVGAKAYGLIASDPDWRWGLSGTTTPIYDSLTLLRQEQKGDWSHPLAKAQEILASL